jgi:hypothetical protein
MTGLFLRPIETTPYMRLSAWILLFYGCSLAGSCWREEFPVGLSFAYEMAYIPEVDGWNKCPPGGFAVDSNKAAAAWDSLYSWVEKCCDNEAVKGLSRWAKKQTASYKRTRSFKGLIFSPVRERSDQKKLVLRAVADILPTHSPVVGRCLILYLLYDRDIGSILSVTITIRGERRE